MRELTKNVVVGRVGKFFVNNNALSALFILLLINVIFTNNFFRVDTIGNIAIQTCTVIITGLGMCLVIASGGIDISIGAVMAMASTVSILLLPSIGVVPSMVVGLVTAAACGGITGLLISKLKLQPIVITLGMQMIIRGVTQVLNNGYMLSFFNEQYQKVGTYKFFGYIPIQIIYIVVATLIIYLIVKKTLFGLEVQSLGDNCTASRMVGINIDKRIIGVYIIVAVFAGFAGLIETAKISSADGNSLGRLSELDAIAAVAIGGTSMYGGKAMVIGTLIGAVVIELINITVNMNNIPDTFAQMFKAIIVVVAVVIQYKKRK